MISVIKPSTPRIWLLIVSSSLELHISGWNIYKNLVLDQDDSLILPDNFE